MVSQGLFERDQIQQQWGSSAEQIRHLEQQLARQRNDWESDARQWKRLERHRLDIGEWLVDSATNENGRVVKAEVDAALGGELYVPCMFTVRANGRQYQLELVSTHFEVTEI